jgi:hypothetical protein
VLLNKVNIERQKINSINSIITIIQENIKVKNLVEDSAVFMTKYSKKKEKKYCDICLRIINLI